MKTWNWILVFALFIAPIIPAEGAVFFSSDFEGEDVLSWTSAIASRGSNNGWDFDNAFGVSLSPGGHARSGSKAMGCSFDSNEDMSIAYRTIPGTTHVFVRFYNNFTNAAGGDFDHAAGMKICRITGGGDPLMFDAILYAGHNGVPEVDNHCGINPMSFVCSGANGGTRMNDWGSVCSDGAGLAENNAWHCVEWEIQLNTVGQNNGVVRLWVDGVLDHERTNLNMINAPVSLDRVGFGGWYSNGAGGNNPCPNPEITSIRYIDDVAIGDSYIGPLTTQTAVTPSRPRGMKVR